MDSLFLGIVTLLRSALKDEAQILPEDFDWDRAVNILYDHHLVGMAIHGAARCGVPRSHPAVRQLTALFCKEVSKSRLQMQQLNVIYSLFQEHGIAYMPVKGAVIKPLYPQNELRAMGDADILIRKKQYPAIRKILLSLGLQKDIESDHEYIWRGGDFKLELHKRLIPSYNKDYYAYYGDGWHLARQDGQSSAYYLSPEDHFIYLLVHFAKHYRDGSISAKNICDFWVYRKAYPNMDESYLSAELGKLKLLDFYRNVLALLDTWFEGAPPTAAVEILTQTAFQGAIHSQEESFQIVSVIKHTKERESFLGSKIKVLWRKLFPPLNALANRYPILLKAPVLLPIIWSVRVFEIVFLHPERRKKGMNASRQLMHMDLDHVSDYENKLRSVGLDFNFSE